MSAEQAAATAARLPRSDSGDACAWIADAAGNLRSPGDAGKLAGGSCDLLVCLRSKDAEERFVSAMEALGLSQDPDVLDTWFSSALWPFSTLGWPDPATAPVDPGRPGLGAEQGTDDCLAYYYPGSCLVTGRDIITLWVARMLVAGLYLLGDVPFSDCFVHANILDGKGERMSKSKGNGIDPADIIERYGADAMRYVLADMQTGTQDIRLPVQAISPFTGKLIDLATARHGRTIFTFVCPETGNEFDVLGTMKDLPTAKVVSERFDVGKAFCTKLWNAMRFALMSISPQVTNEFTLFLFENLEIEDRWILGRLSRAVAEVTANLDQYNPSQAIGAARDFFWGEFCDWYLEMVKPRVRREPADPRAEAVLAHCLDQILRLFHPFVPFITETLWETLGASRPRRGVGQELCCDGLIIRAPWPVAEAAWRDTAAEADIEVLHGVVHAVRAWRSSNNCPPSRKVRGVVKVSDAAADSLRRVSGAASTLAAFEDIAVVDDFERPPTAAKIVAQGLEIFLLDVINVSDERRRIETTLAKLRKDLDQTRRKLSNPKFVQKAPPEVVAEERRREEASLREIALLERGLADLGQG